MTKQCCGPETQAQVHILVGRLMPPAKETRVVEAR